MVQCLTAGLHCASRRAAPRCAAQEGATSARAAAGESGAAGFRPLPRSTLAELAGGGGADQVFPQPYPPFKPAHLPGFPAMPTLNVSGPAPPHPLPLPQPGTALSLPCLRPACALPLLLGLLGLAPPLPAGAPAAAASAHLAPAGA